jgi:hypothetical protein
LIVGVLALKRDLMAMEVDWVAWMSS